MNPCSSLPACFLPVSSLKFLFKSYYFLRKLSSLLRPCYAKAEHLLGSLSFFVPRAFNLPSICPNILGIIAHPSLNFLPRHGKSQYSKIYVYIHNDAALCQLHTCPQRGVITFRCLQASSLTLPAWLSGSWSLLRWVLSCFSCSASGASLWQYLISHPWASTPHPRALPGAEAKMSPVLTLQLQLKLSWQPWHLQNSVLILNLSVLLHWFHNLHLEMQSKCQGNTRTWERFNSGKSLNLVQPPQLYILLKGALKERRSCHLCKAFYPCAIP